MSLLERLAFLSDQMALEPAEELDECQHFTRQPISSERQPSVIQAALPNGKRIRLLKTLLTSACERNCYYCPFRSGRNFRRETLKPDEMAAMFMALQRAGIAEGIFLSSGIVGGGIRTQDQLLATAEILRKRYQYQGYMHLKLMPGLEYAQVEVAMRLANRLSINLEAPNSARLALLAPRKTFMGELFMPLRWVNELRLNYSSYQGWHQRWPSTTTQFVVGAVNETDYELLHTTNELYHNLNVSRAYFSRFKPVPDTPLDSQPAESPQRELRLYQSSFLIRDYGFGLDELPFDQAGNLPPHTDPKFAWAQIHLQELPVEINTADPKVLLRIPGFGPKAVQKILIARRKGRLCNLQDLHKIGINPGRSAPFILLNGFRPVQQLAFEF